MSEVVTDHSLGELVDLLQDRRIAVLSGAGISTESGIPDYRGPKTRQKARNPIQYSAFVKDPGSRSHYWARSAVGWTRMTAVQPNAGHLALARLERAGLLSGIITQNVDRLHQAAGSRNVVELHGTLGHVVCLDCARTEPRDALQFRLLDMNPGWTHRVAEWAPDGDAELPRTLTQYFKPPDCLHCNGLLKPDVVFFGEQVPRDRVERAWHIYEQAEVLLVVGSSLAVYSGYRFVIRAGREGRPVAIINLGPTRGDNHAAVRVEGRLGEVLPALVQSLVPH